MNNIQTGQTNQMQMQMRKMDGTGEGQMKNQGMKEVMQNLSSEDQKTIQGLMQQIPQSDRMSVKDQLKSVDSSSMTNDQYMQTLLNILDPSSSSNSDNNKDKDNSILASLYA